MCTGNQIIWYFVGARKQAQKYLNFSAKWTLLAKPLNGKANHSAWFPRLMLYKCLTPSRGRSITIFRHLLPEFRPICETTAERFEKLVIALATLGAGSGLAGFR